MTAQVHTKINTNSQKNSHPTYANGHSQMRQLTTKWLPQRDLFPWDNQNAVNHNILLLTQYYTRKQHQHFTAILQSNFNQEKIRDTQCTPSLRIIPLCHIHTNKCNPENDISYTQNTIQTQHKVSHIYNNIGRHLITIPEQRLKWL